MEPQVKKKKLERVRAQTVGLNAETKKCRHRADGEICLLTFAFIGLFRLSGVARVRLCLTGSHRDGLEEVYSTMIGLVCIIALSDDARSTIGDHLDG
jgi:hypothetical protein